MVNKFTMLYKVYNPSNTSHSSVVSTDRSGSGQASVASGRVAPESSSRSSAVSQDKSPSGLAAQGYAGRVAPEVKVVSKYSASSNPLSDKYVGDISKGSLAYSARQIAAQQAQEQAIVMARQQDYMLKTSAGSVVPTKKVDLAKLDQFNAGIYDVDYSTLSISERAALDRFKSQIAYRQSEKLKPEYDKVSEKMSNLESNMKKYVKGIGSNAFVSEEDWDAYSRAYGEYEKYYYSTYKPVADVYGGKVDSANKAAEKYNKRIDYYGNLTKSAQEVFSKSPFQQFTAQTPVRKDLTGSGAGQKPPVEETKGFFSKVVKESWEAVKYPVKALEQFTSYYPKMIPEGYIDLGAKAPAIVTAGIIGVPKVSKTVTYDRPFFEPNANIVDVKENFASKTDWAKAQIIRDIEKRGYVTAGVVKGLRENPLMPLEQYTLGAGAGYGITRVLPIVRTGSVIQNLFAKGLTKIGASTVEAAEGTPQFFKGMGYVSKAGIFGLWAGAETINIAARPTTKERYEYVGSRILPTLAFIGGAAKGSQVAKEHLTRNLKYDVTIENYGEHRPKSVDKLWEQASISADVKIQKQGWKGLGLNTNPVITAKGGGTQRSTLITEVLGTKKISGGSYNIRVMTLAGEKTINVPAKDYPYYKSLLADLNTATIGTGTGRKIVVGSAKNPVFYTESEMQVIVPRGSKWVRTGLVFKKVNLEPAKGNVLGVAVTTTKEASIKTPIFTTSAKTGKKITLGYVSHQQDELLTGQKTKYTITVGKKTTKGTSIASIKEIKVGEDTIPAGESKFIPITKGGLVTIKTPSMQEFATIMSQLEESATIIGSDKPYSRTRTAYKGGGSGRVLKSGSTLDIKTKSIFVKPDTTIKPAVESNIVPATQGSGITPKSMPKGDVSGFSSGTTIGGDIISSSGGGGKFGSFTQALSGGYPSQFGDLSLSKPVYTPPPEYVYKAQFFPLASELGSVAASAVRASESSNIKSLGIIAAPVSLQPKSSQELLQGSVPQVRESLLGRTSAMQIQPMTQKTSPLLIEQLGIQQRIMQSSEQTQTQQQQQQQQQQQTQATAQKTTQAQKQLTTPTAVTITTTVPPPPIIPPTFLALFKKRQKRKTPKIKGYVTYIKRYGQYKPLAGVRPRGEAVRVGESVALRTLAASFRIRQAQNIEKPAYGNLQYKPSNVFRSYKIRRGKKIPLQNEWIQKAPERLKSRSEVTELILSRRPVFSGRKKMKGGARWF
jgi:hypothetical protein